MFYHMGMFHIHTSRSSKYCRFIYGVSICQNECGLFT